MMNPELTPAAERALQASLTWASRLGAPEVEPVHVLLGLLEEEEGQPAVLLQKQGVILEDVRTALIGAQPIFPLPEDMANGQPHAHAVIRQLVHAARLLALDLAGERIASSVHLMLAALEQDIDLRSQLAGLGFNAEKVRDELMGDFATPLKMDEPLELLEVTDEIDVARILDANANRAREGMRVLEDYGRFVLNDAYLCEAFKQMRHELVEIMRTLGVDLLLSARATDADVGTRLSVPGEARRSSLRGVVEANAKRLGESLRALEEYAKLRSVEGGARLESLRYRAYVLEKALLHGGHARGRLKDVQLYMLVSRAGCAASLEWTIEEAAAGGVQMVQLREKELPDREWLERIRRVHKACQKAGVPLIVNDRADLARLAGAEGVHLGQEDIDVHEARRLLGHQAIIGVSTHDLNQVHQALQAGADYIGVGPCFPSQTKGFQEHLGTALAKQVAEQTSLPAFAVGGITLNHVPEIVKAGLRRVAVGMALTQADDPRKMAQKMRQALGPLRSHEVKSE